MKDVIFGKNPIIEAIASGQSFEKIMVAQQSPFIQEIRQALSKENLYTPIQQVPLEKLNRITRKNHQGVIAYISFVEYQSIDDVLNGIYEQGETPLLIALDGITDVGNMGAIARSAYCMGAHAIIVPEKGSALINAVAVKASAGAIQMIHLCKVSSLKASLKDIQHHGIQLVATTLSSSAKPIKDLDFTLPTCIVMGNEEKGVGKNICEMANIQAFIPMNRNFDSLNVSVAAGMVLYESMLQRNKL